MKDYKLKRYKNGKKNKNNYHKEKDQEIRNMNF